MPARASAQKRQRTATNKVEATSNVASRDSREAREQEEQPVSQGKKISQGEIGQGAKEQVGQGVRGVSLPAAEAPKAPGDFTSLCPPSFSL